MIMTGLGIKQISHRAVFFLIAMQGISGTRKFLFHISFFRLNNVCNSTQKIDTSVMVVYNLQIILGWLY